MLQIQIFCEIPGKRCPDTEFLPGERLDQLHMEAVKRCAVKEPCGAFFIFRQQLQRIMEGIFCVLQRTMEGIFCVLQQIMEGTFCVRLRTIERISKKRVPCIRHMDPDLVGPSGLKPEPEQGSIAFRIIRQDL